MMDRWQQFFVIMAALSTASQTLTEHLIKKRWALQLDVPKTDLVQEARRESLIHLISGLFGALLAWTTGLHPLYVLGSKPLSLFNLFPSSDLFEYTLTGVLVSYGGSFFNEVVGVLREFKGAQAALRKTVTATDGGGAPSSAVVQSISPGQAIASPVGATDEEGFTDAANAG